MKSLSFLSLAAALAVASSCVVNNDDGDGGDDTTGNATNDPTNGTTNDPTNGTTNDPTNTTNEDESSTGTTPADSSGTAGPADTGGSESGSADDTADDTAGPTGACGWGDTGQRRVPMGYICGGDGEDPEGMYPLDCPEDTELTEGGMCGTIRGQGCCDANGDVWFCAMDGGAPELFTESCQQ